MTGMSRLVVVTTGGTIAASADAGGVLRPERTGAQLAAGLDVEVEVVDLLSSIQLATPPRRIGCGSPLRSIPPLPAEPTGSWSPTAPTAWRKTALWLDLGYGGEVPVVLTGAARSADDPDPDGPGQSARRAHRGGQSAGARPGRAAQLRRNRGGRRWEPRSTAAPAFSAVAPGGLRVRLGIRRHLRQATPLPRHPPVGAAVDLASAYPGADGTAIEALAAAGARGLVIEAMGCGNAGEAVIEAVRRACDAGLAVAATTRVPGGRTAAAYGPAHDLVAAGAVMVPRLRASQARVLLMGALGAGLAVGEVFARWGLNLFNRSTNSGQ